jgi:tetratricopeptide (TPR) repeat protein
VPFDRENALKRAERFLRLGRLDAAITEYQRVVDEVPNDWKTLNALADLCLRANQPARATSLLARIADHLAADGFDSRAQAFYKRILKVTPSDERALEALAAFAVRQGIFVEAKGHLIALSRVRQARGDARGAAEALLRVNTVDPTDFSTRREAARAAAQTGNVDLAVGEFGAIAADLAADNNHHEAVGVLQEAIALAPQDRSLHDRLIETAIGAKLFEPLKRSLATASDWIALADRAAAAGWPDGAALALDEAVRLSPDSIETRTRAAGIWRERPDDAGALNRLTGTIGTSEAETAWPALEVVVDRLAGSGNLSEAVRQLQGFSDAHPTHVAALMKLVEVLVDSDGEDGLQDAQTRLTEAYLQAGSGAEARIIAEDLVCRAPADLALRDLLRRALVLVGEPDPDNAVTEFATQAAALATVLDSEFLGESPPLSAEGKSSLPAEEEIDARRVFQLSSAAIDLSGILSENGSAPVDRPGGENDPAEIDLTEELRGLKPPALDVIGFKKGLRMPDQPERPNLDEVFRDFRSEVSRQTAADEAEKHYKVALTYRDMGMLDDAVRELELAARAPRLRFEAASILARLVRDRGDVPSAIEWFERAAEAPAPTPEAGRALLYELGQALEVCGEVARALAVYLELQADAGEYADLKSRIERLSRAQTES